MPNIKRGMMGAAGVVAERAGTLWVTGGNSNGILGSGDAATPGTSSPIQIGSDSDWIGIWGSAGSRVFALRDNNTLWAWGSNSGGQLGLGNTLNVSSPTQIGSLTTWESASTAQGTAHAIKTDGTLWGWGASYWGDIGDGTTISRSSPVQIGSLTDWDKVASGRTPFLVKDGDTLWSWGVNDKGQIGDGTVIYKSSPVQIGSGTIWSDGGPTASSTFGILTDGKLYQWGSGRVSATGTGGWAGYSPISSPVQIGSLTTWSKLSVGAANGNSIKTDGTLWTWGYNTRGQIGDNSTVDRFSPVQVGALTDWSILADPPGSLITAAIKTDGTLWAWGANNTGQLGLGDVDHRSSPTQVGSRKWGAVTCCGSANLLMIAAAD